MEQPPIGLSALLSFHVHEYKKLYLLSLSINYILLGLINKILTYFMLYQDEICDMIKLIVNGQGVSEYLVCFHLLRYSFE